MSLTTSRSSSSSPDDSDHESAGGRYYSSQAVEEGSSSVKASASMTTPEQRTSRPLDVNNILNPTPQRTLEGSRRRSAAHFDSPRSSSMAHLQGTARSLPPSPIESSEAQESKRRHLAHPPGSRVNRPSSLGIVTPQQHPYGFESRRYSSYSTENIPPLSAPSQSQPTNPPVPSSATTQSTLPFTSTPAPHSYQQTEQQQQRSQQQQPVSTSVSPTTTYSSYAPPGQISLPSATAPTTSYSSHQYGTSSSHHSLGSSYGIPIHSQHGHFPMMALATAHGSIPVSVDTTAASKSADEKRKRNAGASARFRQRRKEREREMTQRITDLEQRLKKAEEERDYYRDMFVRMPQPGRTQQPLPPPPPPPPQPPQAPPPHSNQHLNQQYSHQLPPRLGPLDPPPYGHHLPHSQPPATPFPSGFGGGMQRERTGSYQPLTPGYSQHQQQPPRRDSAMTPTTNVPRREDRYEQEHGRHI